MRAKSLARYFLRRAIGVPGGAKKTPFDLDLVEGSLPTSRRKGGLAALSVEQDLCSVRCRAVSG